MQSLARGSRKFKQFDGADDAPVGKIDQAPESNCHEGNRSDYGDWFYLDRAASKLYRKVKQLDAEVDGKPALWRNSFKSRRFSLNPLSVLRGAYEVEGVYGAEIRNKWPVRGNVLVRAGKLTFYRTDTTLEHITLVRARGLLNAVTEEKE